MTTSRSCFAYLLSAAVALAGLLAPSAPFARTLSVASGLSVQPGQSVQVAVQLSDGSLAQATEFTVDFSPRNNVEVTALALGSLIPAGYDILSNPLASAITPTTPALGPIRVSIGSDGTYMNPGAGSVLLMTVRGRQGCTGTTAITLSGGNLTVDFADQTPQLQSGSITCGQVAVTRTIGVATGLQVQAGQTINVPITLSEGADVQSAELTLDFSPRNNVEVIGITLGALAPTGFDVLSNPLATSITSATPALGPIRMSVAGGPEQSLNAGSGSLVVLSLRGRAGCSGTTAIDLSEANMTVDFEDATPTLADGSVACSAAAPPVTLSAPTGQVVCPGAIVNVPVSLSDGSSVTSVEFTVAAGVAGSFEFVGISPGGLLVPAENFTITTNPPSFTPGAPVNGPVSVLVDSATSMASGGGSVVTLHLRAKTGCSGSTAIDLSGALVSRSDVDTTPSVIDGSLSCPANAAGCASGENVVSMGGLILSPPDTIIELPINLTPSGACSSSILTAEFDVEPSVLELVSPCTVTIGEAAPGWIGDCNEISPGRTRVVVYGQTGAMSAGTVATVRMRIRPETPAGRVTPAGLANCATTQAIPLTECPTRCDMTWTIINAVCIPGDWNCDNSIGITEVQRAVNCLLGRPVPQGCGAADVNGIGGVSALELQCVVNNFLGIDCRSL